MEKAEVVSFIEKHRAMAVVRLSDPELAEPVLAAMYKGGIRVLEITMTVPGALSLIQQAVTESPPDLLIGVGSVLDAETVSKAVEAGAQFIVSSVTKKDIIDQAKKLGAAVLPGAFTPTEIQTAWEWGADIVKVFPANIVGMDFFKAVKAPLPHLKLMPTGGVSLTNGDEWIKAGACAVGVGSALLDKQALQNRDFDQIQKNAELLTTNLKVK